jgi:ATP-dependent Zn protease
MNIKCWGTPGWKFIHIVALSYPDNPSNNDKINYKNFFTNLENILPCKICANHYKENLIKHKLTDYVLSSSDELFNWTVRMHNEVNILNNKQVIDYDTARQLVTNCNDNINNGNINNDNLIMYKYIIFLLIICIIFLLFNKFNLKKYI